MSSEKSSIMDSFRHLERPRSEKGMATPAAGSTIVCVMPTVFRERGFRFFFYSNEGSPREPMHIHVGNENLEAKFWLKPEVRVAYNDGCDARTLRELLVIVEANKDRIERAWDEFFG